MAGSNPSWRPCPAPCWRRDAGRPFHRPFHGLDPPRDSRRQRPGEAICEGQGEEGQGGGGGLEMEPDLVRQLYGLVQSCQQVRGKMTL